MAGHVDVFLFKAYLPESGNLSMADKSRRVSEAAHNFVKMYISQRTGLRYDSLIFEVGKHGKPYIQNGGICFNISHCGNIVLAAFSEEEIGADVELASRSGNAVIERIFTRGERDYVALARTEREARRRFCEIWTAKEAFLKLYGAGLWGNLDFSTADASGVLQTIRSQHLGDAEAFHRNVTLSLGESDFIPKRSEYLSSHEAEFQICVCGRHLGEVNFQIYE